MSSLELDIDDNLKPEEDSDDIHDLLVKLTNRIENINAVLTNIYSDDTKLEPNSENVQEMLNNLVSKIENINLVITDVYANQRSHKISNASANVIETLIGLLNQLILNHNCLKSKINVGELLGLITKIAPDLVINTASPISCHSMDQGDSFTALSPTLSPKLAPLYIDDTDSEYSLDGNIIIEAPIEFQQETLTIENVSDENISLTNVAEPSEVLPAATKEETNEVNFDMSDLISEMNHVCEHLDDDVVGESTNRVESVLVKDDVEVELVELGEQVEQVEQEAEQEEIVPLNNIIMEVECSNLGDDNKFSISRANVILLKNIIDKMGMVKDFPTQGMYLYA